MCAAAIALLSIPLAFIAPRFALLAAVRGGREGLASRWALRDRGGVLCCPLLLCAIVGNARWRSGFLFTQASQTVWPSGLRRWLQAPVRKGVGSNPTAVKRRRDFWQFRREPVDTRAWTMANGWGEELTLSSA